MSYGTLQNDKSQRAAIQALLAGTAPLPEGALGPGTVSRLVADKLGETVSVKDFGAVGDGVTDAAAAIQSALGSGAQVVSIPPGDFLIDAELIMDTARQKLLGAGGRLIRKATLVNAVVLRVQGDGCIVDGVHIENPDLVCSATGNREHAIRIEANDCAVVNCQTRYETNAISVTSGGEYRGNVIVGNRCLECIGAGYILANEQAVTVPAGQVGYIDYVAASDDELEVYDASTPTIRAGYLIRTSGSATSSWQQSHPSATMWDTSTSSRTGIPNAGDGTADKINVYAHTDGRVYFSNRTAASVTIKAGRSSYGEDRGDGITSWASDTVIVGNYVSAKSDADARVGIHLEGLHSSSPGTADDRGGVISGNVVVGPFRRCYVIENCPNSVIQGNSGDGATWYGIGLIGSNASATGNIIVTRGLRTYRRGWNWGIALCAAWLLNPNTIDQRRLFLANNQLYSAGALDAYIRVTKQTTGALTEWAVTGNLCGLYDTLEDEGGYSSVYGIEIGSAEYGRITDNVFADTTDRALSSAEAGNLTIERNDFQRCAKRVRVVVTGTALADVTLKDNRIHITDEASYCVEFSKVDRLVIEQNRIIGRDVATAKALSISNCLDYHLSGNKLRNITGLVELFGTNNSLVISPGNWGSVQSRTQIIPLDQFKVTASLAALPSGTTGNGTSFGFGQSASFFSLWGTSTNNTSVTEHCQAFVALPPNMIPGGSLKFRVQARTTTLRTVASTLDVEVFRADPAGLSSDLVGASATDINATAITTYEWTIPTATLSSAYGVYIRITGANNDTGGASGGQIRIYEASLVYDAAV